MTPQTSRAFIAPEPFSPRLAIVEVAPGLTIAGILLKAVRDGELELEDLGRVAVYVDGLDLEETIEGGREALLDYVPEPGAILNLRVDVAGGGGGGGEKNPLQTVLQIAVIVASFWVGGPSGPLAAASMFVRTAAAVAINVGGSYALGAAFGRDGDQMKEASDRRALEGASNQFRLREAVSLQLGRERVAADMAASPYTQTVGDDTFLHLALAWHYGEATLEDVKIGETLLSDYPAADIEVEHFLTPGVPRESYLFPGSVRQENFNGDALDFAGGGVFEVHTAAAGAERIEVDIALPNGLKYNADSGKVRNEEVAGLIQFAEVGSEVWIGAPLDTGPAVDKNGVNLGAGSFYLNLRTNDAVRRTYGFAAPDPSKQYKVRVKAYDRDGDYPGEGRTWATYWTSLRAINRTRPIADENIAVSFLRIRSSGDLNGALPTITGIVTPVVPVWSGGNWNTKAPTSNQAALARWMMTGEPAATPLRADQIDASIVAAYELIEANGWGAAVQIRDDASQEDALLRLGRAGRFTTYWNGRKLCFVTDWAKPIPRQVFTGRNAEGYRYRRTFPKELHAVIVEFRDPESSSVAGETVVYADGYTAANAELFETLRLDYSCTIERAFKEGRAYLAKRALLVESHEWTAAVDSIATTYGDRVLVRHWSNLYGEADARVDYRHWQGGLVAGVRLDEPVTMVEGETYALDVRRADGVIRNLPLTTVAGTSRTVMFAAPRSEETSPEKGDLVVFGKLDLVSEDVEIVDVEPSGDSRATIRAVRYIGAELVLAETGPIPALTTGITPRPIAPTPRIIGATGSPAGVTVAFELDPVRGALLDSTAVRWRRAAEEGQPDNPWNSLPPLAASERIARTPPILDAVAVADDEAAVYAVDVELRTVLRNGSISNPAIAPAILVSRDVPAPAGVTATGVTRTGADGSAYPAIAIAATALEAGDIQDLVVEVRRVGDAADAWRSGGQPLPSRNPRGDMTNVSGGEFYFVRAQWRRADNWRSAWVTTAEAVSVPAGLIATDSTHLDGVAAGLFVTRLTDVESLASTISSAVSDLETIYGDTVSAAASAVEAAQSEAAAILAASEAAGDAGEAAGSASAAATSASNAAGFSSSAGTFAAAAQSSSVSATTVAAAALPSDFSLDSKFWRVAWYGTPAERQANDALIQYQGTGAFFYTSEPGRTFRAHNFADVAPVGWVKIEPGRRSRITARVRAVDDINGETANVWVRAVAMGADGYAAANGFANVYRQPTAAQGWQDVVSEFDHSMVAGSAYFRPNVILNYPDRTQGLDVLTLRHEDITESAAAGGSASAAATSASSAASSQSAAGSSASAAASSATSAATSAGSASTSAGQASSSATTAEGHASNASTSATNAATSAGLAGGSASAASGSASTASTKATEASNSASAASASQVAATAAYTNAVSVVGNGNFDHGLTGWTDYGLTTWLASRVGWTGVVETSPGVNSTLLGPPVTIKGGSPRYRLGLEWYCFPASPGPLLYYAGVFFYDGNDALVAASDGTGNYPLAPAETLPPGEQHTRSVVIARGGAVPANPYGGTTTIPAAAVRFRPILFYNYLSQAGAYAAINYFTVEDVTESEAAATSATASVTQASNAAASASLAGGYATAAQGSATNAATSESNASTFAGQASTSAGNAASSSSTAGTQASNAAASAATASTQASNASASAASASLFAGIAAGAASGGFNGNAGFDNYPSAVVGATPALWDVWSGFTAQRVSDETGGYSVQIAGEAGGNNGIQQYTAPGTITETGWTAWEVEAELVSGDYTGAGYYFVVCNAAGSGLAGFARRFATEADDAGVVSATKAGRRKWSGLYQGANGGPTVSRLLHYAMSHWSELGSIAAANNIKWHRIAVREASAQEIQQQTVLAPLSASVSQLSTAVFNLQTQEALAKFQVAATTPAGSAILSLISTNGGTIAGISADRIYQGEETFFDNATDTERTTIDGITYVTAKGASFGTDGSLRQWFGPSSVAFSAMSRANAYFYFATTGQNIGGTGFPTGAGAGSGAKPLVGGGGSLVAAGTIASVTASSLATFSATFFAPKITADSTMFGDIVFEASNGGAYVEVDRASVSIDSQGLQFPDGSWSAGSASATGSGFLSVSGTLTLRARFVQTGGSSLFGNTYNMDGSVVVTAPAA